MAEMNREWGFFRTLLSNMVDPLMPLQIELLNATAPLTISIERSINL